MFASGDVSLGILSGDEIVQPSAKIIKDRVYIFTVAIAYKGFLQDSGELTARMGAMMAGMANVIKVDRSIFSTDFDVHLIPLVDGYDGAYWGNTVGYTLAVAIGENWLTLEPDMANVSIRKITVKSLEEYKKDEGKGFLEDPAKWLGKNLGEMFGGFGTEFAKALMPVILIGFGGLILYKVITNPSPRREENL